MYQALYRKWRPKTFTEVIGQSHITDTLRRQVEEGRTAHAYLFTGTRGTGKTTCARILAKAINCLHSVDGEPCNDMTITVSRMEQDLRWLTEHGYHTVLPRELAGGEPLPEKPLLITFDDGYRSNYELLFPLLQAYQMKAVVSIMVYMQDVSADNFLSWDMCREMADSGLVEIGSHAYSLHNLGDLGGNFDPGGINGIQRDPEESDSAFEARVLGDIQKSHDRIAQEVGQPVTFFAYPFGITEPDAEAFVHELFPVTAVTRHGTADLGKGLHELPRMTVTMDRELEDILKD